MFEPAAIATSECHPADWLQFHEFLERSINYRTSKASLHPPSGSANCNLGLTRTRRTRLGTTACGPDAVAGHVDISWQ
jgi:hypothetical protein